MDALEVGGISEFAEFLAPDPPRTAVWRLQGTGNFTETCLLYTSRCV